jgi:hypothetical protein
LCEGDEGQWGCRARGLRGSGVAGERDEVGGGGGGCCAKERVGGGSVRRAFFGKWFTKKSGVNHFPNFNKGFSGQ